MRIRHLRASDLDGVVDIDSALVGRSRRGYFERRLALALHNPSAHMQFRAEHDDRLVGYLLARVLTGEFGVERTVVLLEALGVEPAHKGHGAGRHLLEALEEEMRKRGITELRSQARWTNHELLRFFDAAGFQLAPRQVVECPTSASAIL